MLFLMAAIHARELTTAETATRFAERLVAGYGPDPDITWLLDYNEIHIVPQVNPDGRKRAEGGVLWRKNTNDSNGSCSPSRIGVDLNRNSSFKWNPCGFGCSSGALVMIPTAVRRRPRSRKSPQWKPTCAPSSRISGDQPTATLHLTTPPGS